MMPSRCDSGARGARFRARARARSGTGATRPAWSCAPTDGWLVILDAGTGIRELGRSLLERANGAPIEGDIFLTHAHWDHIQGIPFFAPLFRKGNHFTIWGSKSLQTSIDRVVRDQMSPVVFPVTFEELQARIDFQELAEEQSAGNGLRGVRRWRCGIRGRAGVPVHGLETDRAGRSSTSRTTS